MDSIDFTFMDDGTDLLEHYGVKGMHWGVRNPETLRRYANERKARKARKTDAKNIRAKKKLAKQNRKKQEVVNKERRASIKADRLQANKNRSLLSDAELNRRITRLQREKQLNDLTNAELKPGRTAIKNALVGVGTRTISATTSNAIDKYTPFSTRKK